MRIGLVSDTHGRFDRVLERLFAGVDLIVHAGDVEGQSVLQALSKIAPVEAVRGNVDQGPQAAGLSARRVLALGSTRALLLHELGKPESLAPAMRREVEEAGARIVIYGHSHLPSAKVVGGVLFVNPGSAGPRRFKLPRSAGRLELSGQRVRVEIFDLDRDDLSPLLPALETNL
jgi:uncharacterized protein